MLSESRRKKLEMLTRSLATGDVKAAEEVLRAAGQGVRAGRVTVPPTGPPLALPEAAPGAEARAGKGGAFWLVRRRLAEVSGDYVELQKQYQSVLRGARQRFDELEASVAVCRLADGKPEDPLFLDIETCGLAGCCIFLIGLMHFRDGELVFEQFLARHYGEEPAILHAFADRLASASALVSFNGKAFDMTSLRERSIFHGVDLWEPPTHCDLLHEARRQWRHALPNCRLQTLEQHLCRRRRVGDIPSSEIPQAYHRFVADGDARRLKSILHHNLLDLLTMGQLVCLLLTGQQPEPCP